MFAQHARFNKTLLSDLEFSGRGLFQPQQCFLQPSCKFLIYAVNFAKKSVNCDIESTREFGGIQLPHERVCEWRGHVGRELVYAPAMNNRKAVANASQRKRIVADTAYHVFRLPRVSSCYAAAGVKCVQPAKADDVGTR
jgi:hypothetical protein